MYKQTIEISPSVQTIVWDLDGTLLDSFGILQSCLNDVLRECGKPEVPEEIMRHNHHGSIEGSITNMLLEMGEETTESELAAIFKNFYTLDNAYIQDVDHHLFEDAARLVDQAHEAGKRQIVVTNRPHGVDRQNGSPRNIIQNSRLSKAIDGILCGDESEFRKPLRQVLEARFGQDLSSLGEMIVIGDQFVDAEFAHNIGCAAILVARAETIAHLDKLNNWEEYVRITPSLQDVKVAVTE